MPTIELIGGRRKRALRIFSMIMLVLLTIAQPAIGGSRDFPAEAHRPTVQSLSAVCDQVVAVPSSECTPLVALYTATSGANWAQATGWLTLRSAASPCDWYGVVCANGHVVELALARNRLSGTLPAALANLPYLERLALNSNRLRGNLPSTICALTDTVTTADFSYNMLTTPLANLRACLNRIDPDWTATQTVMPRGVQATSIENAAVELSWTPISYTGDGGFYEISYATTGDGPYTTAGRTADKRASSYRLTGLRSGTTYYVRIQTVTPAHANHADELRSDYTSTPIVTRADATFLLMVYLPADNDLSPYVEPIAERLRAGSAVNSNVQIVMLSDRSGPDDTRLVTIANGQVQLTNVVAEQWGRSELNTADPAVLAWFLSYARATYPADREIVSLMGHGLALAPEIEWPETPVSLATEQAPARQAIPVLPKEMPATPDDITDRDYLSTIDLGQALAAATSGGAEPFDVVFFDQCFQGNLDTLYEVRTAATFFIASPNYAWLAAPYDRYLLELAPAAPTEAIVDGIIERYQGNLNNWHPNVIFGLRRADIDALASATSALGAALQRALRGGARGLIVAATGNARYVDTTQCGEQNLTLGPPDELIGLGTFARNLATAFPVGDRYGVHARAEQVDSALANLRKSVRTGSPYLAPDEFWDYDNTVTILAPLPVDSPASVAWRSSIYTQTAQLQASWTPAPTMTVTITGTFAFVRDGSWDEFLAAWYRRPLAPTVGEWCHYIPPALVEGDDLEPLTLSAASLGASSIRLTWTPSANEDVINYVIYAKSAADIGWTARSIVRLDQSTLIVDDLLPDQEYHYMVVAQDAAGVIRSQSNEVIW